MSCKSDVEKIRNKLIELGATCLCGVNFDPLSDKLVLSTQEFGVLKYCWDTSTAFLENLPYLSFEDAKRINDNSHVEGKSLYYEMAKRGYKFTADQLLEINNNADDKGDTGWTLMHEMVVRGHKFTVNELKRLGNPGNKYGVTPAHLMFSEGHKFSFDDILELGNPATNKGKTLAHLLAKRGYRFNVAELLVLGDPSDEEGNTVSGIMAEKGNPLSAEERRALIEKDEQKGIILYRLQRKQEVSVEELLPYPELLEQFC